MNENFDIYNHKSKKDDEKPLELNNKERKEFELQLEEEINALVNAALDESEVAEEPTEPDNAIIPNNPLENKPLYQQVKKDLERSRIINSDPTGKNKKASGEDI